MIIDTHTHFIPRFVLEDTPFGLAYDGSTLSHPEHMRYVVEPRFLDVEARLDEMTRQGIDMSVVSLSPTLFFYDQPSDVAAEYARRANDALAEMVSSSDRLVGVATLPLQDPVAAARELDRAVTELGLHGAQIGTNTETLEIDAPALEAVFATAERLDVPMMLHPYFLGAKERLEDFYMTTHWQSDRHHDCGCAAHPLRDPGPAPQPPHRARARRRLPSVSARSARPGARDAGRTPRADRQCAEQLPRPVLVRLDHPR